MRQVHQSRRENQFHHLVVSLHGEMSWSTNNSPTGWAPPPAMEAGKFYPILQSKMSSGGLVSFLIVKHMHASESWGTKYACSCFTEEELLANIWMLCPIRLSSKRMSTLQLYTLYQHWNTSAFNRSAPLRLIAYIAQAYLVCRLKHSPIALFLWHNELLVQQVWF